MIKHHRALVCIIVTLVGVSTTTAQSRASYAVYSAVLREMARQSAKDDPKAPPPSFVIVSSHLKPGAFSTRSKIYVTDHQTIARLNAQDEADYTASVDAFERSHAGVKAGDGCGAPWTRFYKTFPGAWSYYKFSNLRFSPNKRVARVTVNGRGDSGYDSEMTYVMKRRANRWTVYRSSGGWGIC